MERGLLLIEVGGLSTDIKFYPNSTKMTVRDKKIHKAHKNNETWGERIMQQHFPGRKAGGLGNRGS